MTIDKKIFGNNVRRIRKNELKESQEKFAEGINKSVYTVGNIERGIVEPSLQTVLDIAEYTGRAVEELFKK